MYTADTVRLDRRALGLAAAVGHLVAFAAASARAADPDALESALEPAAQQDRTVDAATGDSHHHSMAPQRGEAGSASPSAGQDVAIDPTSERAEPFVGRSAEMAAMLAGLEAVDAGTSGLFLILGEPGAGKTRLVSELANEARRRSASVYWGRCWEAGGAPVYRPWLQVIRAALRGADPDDHRRALDASGDQLALILPELRQGAPESTSLLEERLETEVVRFRLFDGIASTLRTTSGGRRTVIILEDLHAADAPSLLLARHLGMELVDAPFLMIFTCREGELRPSDARHEMVAELGRVPGATRLTPRPLSVSDIAEYLDAATAGPREASVAEALHRKTEGNPLYVTELIRMLVNDPRLEGALQRGELGIEVPEGVRAFISQRLALLSAGCREVLTVFSVVGVEAPADVLIRACGVQQAELIGRLEEAAVASLVIAPSSPSEPWRFGHALTREVIYSGIAISDRTRLHRHVGSVLEGLGGDAEPDYGVLAHHFLESGPEASGMAVRYARLGAERATQLSAHEEAVRLYRRALEATDGPGEERVSLLIDLGEAAARAGDAPTVRQAFLEAAEEAERLGRHEDLARAAVGYGGRYGVLRAGDDTNLIPLLRRAIDTLEPEDSLIRARLLARLASALRDEQDMAPRVAMSLEAVEMARRLDDPAALTFALTSRYFAIAGPDNIDEMRAVATESRAVTDATGDRAGMADVNFIMFDLLQTTGADRAAIRAEVDGLGEAVRLLRHGPMIWALDVLRGNLALGDGRLAEAEGYYEEAWRRGKASNPYDAEASHRWSVFSLHREQARVDEVAEPIHRAIDQFRGHPAFACLDVFIEAVAGREQSVRRRLAAWAANDYRFLPRDAFWLFAMSYLGEAVMLAGDRDRARDLEQLLAPFAHLLGAATVGEVTSGPVALTLGGLAALRDDHDRSVAHLERAMTISATSGLRLWEARAAARLANVLVRRGRPEDTSRARELAAETLVVARELGLTAVEGEARRVNDLIERAPVERDRAVRGMGSASFAREGDMWRIGAREPFRLKDSKGLRYLAMLLAEPGRELHVLDLVNANKLAGSLPDSGSEVGEAAHGDAMSGIPEAGLDAEAKRAYRARIAELMEEQVSAESDNDPARLEQVRAEIDALTAEVGHAYGLGGRARVVGSQAERARQSVTKAIRSALKRIEDQDAVLGTHLRHSVRTGLYCAYDPDPSEVGQWRFD